MSILLTNLSRLSWSKRRRETPRQTQSRSTCARSLSFTDNQNQPMLKEKRPAAGESFAERFFPIRRCNYYRINRTAATFLFAVVAHGHAGERLSLENLLTPRLLSLSCGESETRLAASG